MKQIKKEQDNFNRWFSSSIAKAPYIIDAQYGIIIKQINDKYELTLIVDHDENSDEFYVEDPLLIKLKDTPTKSKEHLIKMTYGFLKEYEEDADLISENGVCVLFDHELKLLNEKYKNVDFDEIDIEDDKLIDFCFSILVEAVIPFKFIQEKEVGKITIGENDLYLINILTNAQEQGILNKDDSLEIEMYEIDEYYDASKWLDHWFDSKLWRKKGYNFSTFAQDGTGSLFCLWKYKGIGYDMPIVYFGSQGEYCLVSNSISELLDMINSGWIFSFGKWSYKGDYSTSKYIKKVMGKLAPNYLNTPELIRKRALKKHPNFNKWIEDSSQ